MAFMTKTNFGYSTLASRLLIAGTSAVVASGHGARFPAAGNFPCVIWRAAYANPQLDSTRELVLCTARTTDTLTITRAQEGTTAIQFEIADKIAMVISAAFVTQIETEIGLKANAAVEAWTDFSPVAGWSVDSQLSYKKDPFGFVHLKGYAHVTSGTPSYLYFSIPASYRPATTVWFIGGMRASSSPGHATIISVDTSGNIAVTALSSGDYVYLDGIIYHTS